MPFEERVRLVVDDAYSTFTHSKVEGLIRRAGLRYPNADLRRIDLLDERSLNRQLLTQLGTCSFVARQQNVVFQGFTGSGKSYLGCAIARRACEHRIRAHYVRMPDLEEAWVAAQDSPGGSGKFLRKYAAFTLLVIDEWLLDRPTESMRGHVARAHGAPLWRNVDSVLHAVVAEGLAPAPRLRCSRGRDHGPDHPQHDLG